MSTKLLFLNSISRVKRVKKILATPVSLQNISVLYLRHLQNAYVVVV